MIRKFNKTLNLSEKVWKELTLLRINKDHKNIDETIAFLLKKVRR